ncbi:hypothetical protein [Lichenicoccus roseus]|uniref:Uncharacterized protein n=1 Tax=Lichenicoccus roseus TaxID=2683649 RepID=A0A5R9J4M9_9PROT|nr:hypothetical protein [Lichenicoccus roseus]TLU71467.1 hypothetical protein FE263_16335 [Lichenicoccus roseus]
MSGSTDTSTAVQRVAFCTLVTGAGGAALTVAAAAVARCTLTLPEDTAYLLSLPAGATFAQGAAQLQLKWSQGLASI